MSIWIVVFSYESGGYNIEGAFKIKEAAMSFVYNHQYRAFLETVEVTLV